MLGCERRVRAQQHQPEPLVVQRLARVGHDRACLLGECRVDLEQRLLAARDRLGAQPVVDPPARGRQQPRGRVAGRAVARPGLGGRGERVAEPVLGEVETTELGDEQGQQPAPLVVPDVLEVGQPSTTDLTSMRYVLGEQASRLDGCVEIGQLDEVETADLLRSLGERTLGHRPRGRRPGAQAARLVRTGQPGALEHLAATVRDRRGVRPERGEDGVAAGIGQGRPAVEVVGLGDGHEELHEASTEWSVHARISMPPSASDRILHTSTRSSRSSLRTV